MAPTATQPGHLGSVDASAYLLDLKDISSIKEKPSVDSVEEKLISGGNSSAQCTVEDSDETLLIKPDLVEEVSTLQIHCISHNGSKWWTGCKETYVQNFIQSLFIGRKTEKRKWKTLSRWRRQD